MTKKAKKTKSPLLHTKHRLSNVAETLGYGAAVMLNEAIAARMRIEGLDPDGAHNRLFHKLVLRAQVAFLLNE